MQTFTVQKLWTVMLIIKKFKGGQYYEITGA